MSNQPIKASLSTLFLSIGSSAAMALGLAPHPQNGKTTTDKNLAKFNIDLLLILKEKTKGNLDSEEEKLIGSLLQDLQVKFVQIK